MALKAVIKSLDEITTDEVKALYVEKDGVFVLDLEGVEDHPTATGLSNALKVERTERKDFEKKYKDLEKQLSAIDLEKFEKVKDIDPDDYTAKLAKLKAFETEAADRDNKKLKDNNNWDALEKQLKDQHQAQLDSMKNQFGKEKELLLNQIQTNQEASDTKITQMQSSLVQDKKLREITEGLAKAKGNISILMPHVAPLVDVRADESGAYKTVVLDAQGNERLNTMAQPMSVDELISEFKQKPEFSGDGIFEKEKQPGGSGSKGGRTADYTGPNPFAKGSKDWNLTEQAKIYTENPQLAQQLKDAAAAAGEE